MGRTVSAVCSKSQVHILMNVCRSPGLQLLWGFTHSHSITQLSQHRCSPGLALPALTTGTGVPGSQRDALALQH